MVSIQKILERYGNRINRWRGAQSVTFRGFLQHSAAKSQRNMKREFCPLGEVPGGEYVLLAPTDVSLSVGDILEQGSLKVVLRRVEAMVVKDRQVYQWGLCEQTGGDQSWAPN